MSCRCVWLALLLLVGCGSDGAAPDSPIPATPETLLVSARLHELVIGWRDVASNETKYRIEIKTPDTEWSLLAETGPNISSYVHVGVTHNVTYFYRVQACNDAGCSQWVEASGKWQGTFEPTITSVVVSQIAATSANVIAATISGGAPTQLVFSIRKISTGTIVLTSAPITLDPSGAEGSSGANYHFAGGLEPQTAYEPSLRATNVHGTHTLTGAVFTTTAQALPSFTDAETLFLPGGPTPRIRINPGGLDTQYTMEVATETGSFATPVDTRSGSVMAAAPPLRVTHTFPNLQPNTAYKWRVVAQNAVGTAISATISFGTP